MKPSSSLMFMNSRGYFMSKFTAGTPWAHCTSVTWASPAKSSRNPSLPSGWKRQRTCLLYTSPSPRD
eukprot:15186780-Alexandrium_andersonii.AAC.1